MFGPQRHKNLAGALPVPPGGAVVDLGCGRGLTLGELAARVDGASRLVGVDLTPAAAPDERVEHVAADLNEQLPFADDEFDSAVCHNVIEYLHEPDAFIAEASRILAPGGHLLLGHTDFDTLMFSAVDVVLTRRLVHHFADTVQPWMTVTDGTIGRRLVALGRHSPLDVENTFACVGHHTTLEPGGPAHQAAMLVAKDGRRDYAVLLRTPVVP